MLRIICFATKLPEVRIHRLLASGSIFLREESSLVLRDLVQIVRTVPNGLTHSRKTRSHCHLAGRGRRAALRLLAQIQAVTIGVLGRRYTVGAKQHFLTAVLTILTGFTQCAGYTVDTRAPFYMCHFAPTMFYIRLA